VKPGGQVVLVVDDDRDARELVVRLLVRAGLRAETATDGHGALAAIARRRPDLVLLDSVMPGLDGLATLRALRAEATTADLPVVLLTALGDPEHTIAGLEAGADDYVPKTVSDGELLARVRARLRPEPSAPPVLPVHATSAEGVAVSFEPLVDLASHDVVGYEARPDVEVPADDRWVERVIASASAVPPDVWLCLDVAPWVLTEPSFAERVTSLADRAVVVELSEHAPVDDYGALVDAIAHLGEGVRVAIDDAGTGYDTMRHLLTLRPAIVKLDSRWVHAARHDAAGQALVAGLGYFAGYTGCRLVAQGLVHEADAITLAGLGVSIGQGPLFADGTRPAAPG
jgi:CheY-like chemotaxis protein/EAL domain-containing protein (putative c-di-GMP-specific phosphodiesterase class I)